ncbi:hypothetical protein [Actinosynnema sp. NPDC020468]|uniref:hypothetical protein n=1 Tax=Actinosynnema sp. NPDC020468 TaxID=3154488 RepID=UPI00340CF150
MTPTLATLRASALTFGGYDQPDRSWSALTLATAPGLDLALPAHRDAAHVWLNAWGCRIRKPRDGEPRVFDEAVAAWWERWHTGLPAREVWLAELSDEDAAALGECFADLAATRAAPTRTLGPTAASKLLFALRPNALMPWDNLIAQRLHGARDGAAYTRHLTTGRTWARAVLAESGLAEAVLVEQLGRPGGSLAKVLDEYCYLVYTRDWVAAP